jgi:predicted RNase H-like nuclease (RuvC/YqgF family)
VSDAGKEVTLALNRLQELAEQSIRELTAEIETLQARIQTLELTNAEMGVELATARNELAEFGARAQAFVQQATTLRAAEATIEERNRRVDYLGSALIAAEATVREQAAALARVREMILVQVQHMRDESETFKRNPDVCMTFNECADGVEKQLERALSPAPAAKDEPLSDAINGLPERLRSFVTDLEQRGDPAGDVRTAHEQRQNADAMAIALAESEARVAELEAKLAEQNLMIDRALKDAEHYSNGWKANACTPAERKVLEAMAATEIRFYNSFGFYALADEKPIIEAELARRAEVKP